ncbi:hypothetical protein BGZ94_004310, partial [Podila epigama]
MDDVDEDNDDDDDDDGGTEFLKLRCNQCHCFDMVDRTTTTTDFAYDRLVYHSALGIEKVRVKIAGIITAGTVSAAATR